MALKPAMMIAAAAMLVGAGPVVKVTGVAGGLDTGAPLRLSVITAARSDAGNAAQPPFAWIDYEETVDPAAATCDRRAERLLGSGPLQPATSTISTLPRWMRPAAFMCSIRATVSGGRARWPISR